MKVDRCTLLAAASGLAVWPALAQETLPAFAAYECEPAERSAFMPRTSSPARRSHGAPRNASSCAAHSKPRWRRSCWRGSTRARIILNQMIADRPEDLLEYAPTARQNLARNAKASMSVADMCAAIGSSATRLANLLLVRVGGPPALTAFRRSTGDTVTRLDHKEPELNRSPPGDPNDTTTPLAMAGACTASCWAGVVAGFAPAPDRLDAELQDRRQPAARRPAKRLEGADKTGNSGKDAAR